MSWIEIAGWVTAFVTVLTAGWSMSAMSGMTDDEMGIGDVQE